VSQKPTLILKQLTTIEQRVDIAIPADNPVIRGHITCDFVVRSKEAFRELSGKGLSDEEYIRAICSNIRGLASPDTGELLDGEAALQEAISGIWSAFLIPGIARRYGEQFAEASAKNSGPLSRR